VWTACDGVEYNPFLSWCHRGNLDCAEWILNKVAALEDVLGMIRRTTVVAGDTV
jgi:hypothetical protein